MERTHGKWELRKGGPHRETEVCLLDIGFGYKVDRSKLDRKTVG